MPFCLAIFSAETGKKAASLIEDTQVTNQNLASVITNKISKGLDLANDLLSVRADKVINFEKSVVRYVFTSLDNQEVFIDVDYDGEHGKIQNVALMPSQKKSEGDVVYQLPTDKGAKVLLTFSMKNGEVNNVHIDTDFRPLSSNSDPSVFLVKSDGGFLIRITFNWVGNAVKSVNIVPVVNPYLPLETLTF